MGKMIVSPSAVKNLNNDTAELRNEMAIVVNGDTSTVDAAIGDYVIVKNSTITNIDDGIYTAAKAITAETAIDDSYLSDSGLGKGAINAVNEKVGSPSSASSVTGSDAFSKINTLNSKITGLVKRLAWTGTPSSNGNVSFDNDIDVKKNFVIGASLHKSGDNSVGVIAVPYQYTSARVGYCAGFHLFAEGGNPSTPYTSAVAGYIYYIPMSV